MKGFCEVCGTGIEVQMCCKEYDCGWMGVPVEPPVCNSEGCYNIYMDLLKLRSKKVMDNSWK